MKNIKSSLTIALVSSICYQANAAQAVFPKFAVHQVSLKQDSLSNDVFLKQVMLYGLKQKQLTGLVAENTTNEKTKSIANDILNAFTSTNEELLTLAKSKNVSLPNTKLPGELRPDGRVDSTPENLKDTSRNQNQGEVRNIKQTTSRNLTAFNMLDDAAILRSVNDLKALKGKQFDERFLLTSQQDYQNLIMLLEAGKKSSDMDIKNFASKNLTKFKKLMNQVNK